ncbi:PIN domain-containing protein [Kitasatospora purpeofusca]|uniref:PIN domain-containing protein n=1 Tax=Kitasatospora purpeofusca TaxID=67352 RepID=UPI003249DA99
MRLRPGFTLDDAQRELAYVYDLFDGLRDSQVGEAVNAHRYLSAVDTATPHLRAFNDPDLAAILRSTTYWQIFSLTGLARANGNQAAYLEVNAQTAALFEAQQELDALKEYASRPGLAIFYDTHMINHWKSPSDILWQQVLKKQGRPTKEVRLVVPDAVIGELDQQKYGQGDLAKRAATALVYLETTLRDTAPGQPVELRQGVTLEVRMSPPGPREAVQDVDWHILQAANDLQQLNPASTVLVLCDDTAMKLRARQIGLETFCLPNDHRKTKDAKAEAEEALAPTS